MYLAEDGETSGRMVVQQQQTYLDEDGETSDRVVVQQQQTYLTEDGETSGRVGVQQQQTYLTEDGETSGRMVVQQQMYLAEDLWSSRQVAGWWYNRRTWLKTKRQVTRWPGGGTGTTKNNKRT